MIDRKGFSGYDVELLTEAHQAGVIDRGWGRAQFVTNDFSQYMAIWERDAPADHPPGISIVRFDRTGTYALVAGGRIIASDNRLSKILPAATALTPKYTRLPTTGTPRRTP